jgi:hypothetical protein
MPTQTDRDKLKDQQKGTLRTAAGVSDPAEAVNAAHRRTFHVNRSYAANDAATFTQQLASTVRKARCKAIKIDTIAAITGNATNYELFTFFSQLSNGTAGVTLGTWNTHTSAQNTIAANVTGSVTVVTNADAELTAGTKVLVTMAPQGTGWNVAYPGVSFTVDLEEI